jgi:hypothetical protein
VGKTTGAELAAVQVVKGLAEHNAGAELSAHLNG